MTNLQTIPTQEESLLIYLQNQINQTNGNIIRIKETLISLDKNFDECQSSEVRMKWGKLIDDSRLELDNYEFRLDFLQTQLEEFNTNLK